MVYKEIVEIDPYKTAEEYNNFVERKKLPEDGRWRITNKINTKDSDDIADLLNDADF